MPRTFLVRRVGTPGDNSYTISETHESCEIEEQTSLTAAVALCHSDNVPQTETSTSEDPVGEARVIGATVASDSLTKEIGNTLIVNEETGEIKSRETATAVSDSKSAICIPCITVNDTECPVNDNVLNSSKTENTNIPELKVNENPTENDVNASVDSTSCKSEIGGNSSLSTSKSTPSITPYQTLPSFASLAYNMVLTNRNIKQSEEEESMQAKHALPKVTVRSTTKSSLAQRKLPMQSPSFKVWNDLKPSSIIHPNSPLLSEIKEDLDTQVKTVTPPENSKNVRKTLLPVMSCSPTEEKVKTKSPLKRHSEKYESDVKRDTMAKRTENKENFDCTNVIENVKESVHAFEDITRLSTNEYDARAIKSEITDDVITSDERLKPAVSYPILQTNKCSPRKPVSSNCSIVPHVKQEREAGKEVVDQENMKPKIWNPMFHVFTPKRQMTTQQGTRLPLTPVSSDNIKQEIDFKHYPRTSLQRSSLSGVSVLTKDNIPPEKETEKSSENSQKRGGAFKYSIDSLLAKDDNSSKPIRPCINYSCTPTLRQQYGPSENEIDVKSSPEIARLRSQAFYGHTGVLKREAEFDVKWERSESPAKRQKLDNMHPQSDVIAARTSALPGCSTPVSMKNVQVSTPCPPNRSHGGEMIATPIGGKQLPMTPMMLSPGILSPLINFSFANLQTPTNTTSSLEDLMKNTPIQRPVTPVQQTPGGALTPMSVKRSTDNSGMVYCDENSSRNINKTVSQNVSRNPNVELINGGFGIKNPSFRPPRPADITNIHQDNGKGRYSCKICNKEFALQRLLNRHLKCHSDTKRYLCMFCGKGFNDTFDLKRHTRIHTGVKPYKCSHCDRSFTQRCSLESHCRKVHNVDFDYGYKQRRSKIYVCEECGNSTDDPQEHFNHLKKNHPNNPALSKSHDKRQFKFGSELSVRNVLRPRN